MDDKDYPLQKIVFSTSEIIDPKQIQEKFINYFNNMSSIKNEQQARFAALTLLEKNIQTDINAIDSIMFNRAAAAKKVSPATSEQVLVNTASRSNVEGEILYMSEKLTKKLYGIQKLKNDAERGVTVISNLRISQEKSMFSNNLLKYALYGFILATLIILGIQFNKYLEKVAKQKSL